MHHQYTLSDLKDSRKELMLTKIDEETLEQAEKKVLNDLSKTLKIKGFRPGKIPLDVVKQQIDESYLKSSCLEQALSIAFEDIVREASLKVLGGVEVKIESKDPLKIRISFDVYPIISVSGYKDIAVQKKRKKATDQEVNTALEEIKRRMVTFKKVDRAGKENDRVHIDFEGFSSDHIPLENTHSKNYPLVLGSHFFIPGFEEQIMGMKEGEEKEFPLSFPKDYHAKHLKGKEVTFKVRVIEVEESIFPSFDEAGIEKLTGKKQTLEEWKKVIEEQIQAEHNLKAQHEMEEQYFAELVKKVNGELPKTLLEEEKKSILREIKEQILRQGLSYEHYLHSTGKNEEELIESFSEQAAKRIKLRLALEEIAQQEGITITDLDLEQRLKELTEHLPEKKREEVKSRYQPGESSYLALQVQIKLQKTLEFLLPKV